MVLATSRPYVFISVDGPGDVTTTLPEIAIITDTSDGTEPGDSDWHAASWINGEAALLIGPGTPCVYAAGQYMAYVRITAGSERVVLPSGRIRVGDTRP